MLRTTDLCSSRSSMAAATIGSSKIFPHDGMPRLVVKRDGAFEMPLGDHLEQRGGALGLQRQVAHLVNDQEAGAGEEPHGGGPAALDRGAVAAGDQVGGGGVVGAVAGGDGGVAQADGEHGLADAGRADQQDVGGVVEEPQGAQLGDELAVDRGLGVEVEVGRSARARAGRRSGPGWPAGGPWWR